MVEIDDIFEFNAKPANATACPNCGSMLYVRDDSGMIRGTTEDSLLNIVVKDIVCTNCKRRYIPRWYGTVMRPLLPEEHSGFLRIMRDESRR